MYRQTLPTPGLPKSYAILCPVLNNDVWFLKCNLISSMAKGSSKKTRYILVSALTTEGTALSYARTYTAAAMTKFWPCVYSGPVCEGLLIASGWQTCFDLSSCRLNPCQCVSENMWSFANYVVSLWTLCIHNGQMRLPLIIMMTS